MPPMNSNCWAQQRADVASLPSMCETLQRWQILKTAASETIVAHGGTISHQHGVGTDHAPYLASEKGQVGISLLEAVQQRLDPHKLLNPGKLLGGD